MTVQFGELSRRRHPRAAECLALAAGWPMSAFDQKQIAASKFWGLEQSKEEPMRFATIVLLFLTAPACAQSVFLTYRQWEQLPVNLRELYVAGAFDTLSTVTTPEQVDFVKHYNECVAKAALNLRELAENMKGYAETQSDLRDKPTPFALMRYLISICGPAAQ